MEPKCECLIIRYKGSPGWNIDYCPKHQAVDALIEALSEIAHSKWRLMEESYDGTKEEWKHLAIHFHSITNKALAMATKGERDV